MKKCIILGISVILFFLSLPIIKTCLVMYLCESRHFQKGMLYTLLIDSKVIKNFPKVEMVGQETYSTNGDPAPFKQGVSYLSNAKKEDLVVLFDRYLTELGYTKKTIYTCEKELWYEIIVEGAIDYETTIVDLSPEKGKIFVSVTYFYR